MSHNVVEIMFAKNVPAYARTTARKPSDQSLEDFLREFSGELMGDLVFQPDWQQASGERVVDAGCLGETIQGLLLEGQDDFDVAEKARKALHQHWELMAKSLPDHVLNDLQSILGRRDTMPATTQVAPSSSPENQAESLRLDIEGKLRQLRAIIDDPVEIAFANQVSIEIRPEGEGDAVLVSRKDWGYTLVNYGQASLKATIYDGSPAIDPVHHVEIDYVDLLDETVRQASSLPAE